MGWKLFKASDGRFRIFCLKKAGFSSRLWWKAATTFPRIPWYIMRKWGSFPGSKLQGVFIPRISPECAITASSYINNRSLIYYRWWQLKYFLNFTATWGRCPFRPIFFKGGWNHQAVNLRRIHMNPHVSWVFSSPKVGDIMWKTWLKKGALQLLVKWCPGEEVRHKLRAVTGWGGLGQWVKTW